MSTSAIQRAAPASPVSAAIATAQIFPQAQPLGSIGVTTPAITAAQIAAMLMCPGSNRLEQKPFTVRASGNATTAGAFTAIITLYAAIVPPAGVASLVAANWTAIAATAAVAIGTTSAAWLLECEMIFESVVGKLNGQFSSNINNTFVGGAAITPIATGINGATEPALAFAVGITFSTANAGNIGRLADFSLNA